MVVCHDLSNSPTRDPALHKISWRRTREAKTQLNVDNQTTASNGNWSVYLYHMLYFLPSILLGNNHHNMPHDTYCVSVVRVSLPCHLARSLTRLTFLIQPHMQRTHSFARSSRMLCVPLACSAFGSAYLDRCRSSGLLIPSPAPTIASISSIPISGSSS